MSLDFKILLNGKDLSKAGFNSNIRNIRVDESDSTTSYCELVLESNTNIRDVIKEALFTSNNVLRIYAGRTDVPPRKDQQLIGTFITEIPKFKYMNGKTWAYIRGYGEEFILAKNYSRKSYPKGMTVRQIVENIAEKYGFETSINIQNSISVKSVQQAQNDAYFLKSLARDLNYDFFIQPRDRKNGLFTFAHKPHVFKQINSMNYRKGNGEIVDAVFEINTYDNNRQIVIVDYDAETNTVIRESIDMDSILSDGIIGKELTEKFYELNEKYFPGKYIKTPELASRGVAFSIKGELPKSIKQGSNIQFDRNTAKLTAETMQFDNIWGISGTLRVELGSPDIKPRTLLLVGGVGRFDGTYYVESVNHMMHNKESNKWLQTIKVRSFLIRDTESVTSIEAPLTVVD